MKTNPGHIGHSSNNMGPSLNGIAMPRPHSARRRRHPDSAFPNVGAMLASKSSAQPIGLR